MVHINNSVFSYMLGVFILFLTFMISETTVPENDPNYVGVNGDHFVLHKKPFLFNGFNAYWLMSVATEPNDRNKVTQVFKDASAVGLSVCRTWAFSDGGYNSLQTSPGNYNEPTFQALDFVLSEASKYNIRLILSFVNNWPDYGGKTQYIQWARNEGEQIKNDDDFYTNAVIKEYYKNHVTKVVTRVNTISGITYGNDPVIMAWELMNEPRCQFDFSGRTVNGWVQEMASHVKSLDNKHLLGVGMEGFYGDSMPDKKPLNPGYQVGTDFISNQLIPEIDFASIHAYTLLWLPGQSEAAQLAWMQEWIRSHWQDSKKILRKPLVLGEFGKSTKGLGSNFSARDTFVSTVYETTYNLAKDGGTMAGSLIWQVFPAGMESFYDGSDIVLSQPTPIVEIISRQSKRMTSLIY